MDPRSYETQNFVNATAYAAAGAAGVSGIFIYYLLRLVWRYKVQYFLGVWGLMAFCVLSDPFSRDYYFGEIPHCFTSKCITGPEAENRLDALGVKYKNSPENYAIYKMFKFHKIEAKKKAAQKTRLMNN